TYGGNPVVCAAANAVIDTLDEAFLAQVTQRSDALAAALHEKLKDKQGFVHVRHLGMLIGIEFDHDLSALVQQALEAGLLINVTQQNTIRLLPPLNISEQDSDILVEKLAALLP
ncbi:MAG: aminotransferase class III-fold pyridoxal phosphate-dependent enzyme, partial [Pseudomonadota bacterium]|nr:aminotransferase class III-fold pyridoxal phosphate-dependent enzyme [Pseudomonadota bacterium]